MILSNRLVDLATKISLKAQSVKASHHACLTLQQYHVYFQRPEKSMALDVSVSKYPIDC